MISQFHRNKILAHLPVINEYIDTGQCSAPITVELSLTNVCNHDCPGCSGWRKEGGLKSHLTTEDARRILNEIKECGAKAVTFTGGGDPTCHPDYADLIQHASSLGLDVGLITNGTLLRADLLHLIVPSCVWIRVSWDAATPDLHDEIHYNGDLNILMKSPKEFWKVVNNTRMLCKYKETHSLKATIGCAFLVGPQTKRDIVPFAPLARDTGVNYCQYRPFHFIKYDEVIWERMEEAKEKYQTEDFAVLFSEFKFSALKTGDMEKKYGLCHGSHFNTHIGANYKVYVCCHLMNHDFACIGDLRENSFKDIWRSSTKSQVIKNIDLKKCVPLCRNDSANKILDNIVVSENSSHPNFL